MTPAPWLILRSLRMSGERMTGWLTDLNTLGVETYYPMIREMRRVPLRKLSPMQRHSGVTMMRPRVVPFLPQAIFVRGMSAELLDHPRVCGRVTGFLSIGSELARAPDWEIAKLRRRELDGVLPGASSAEWIFGVGDEVEVLNGAYTTFRGIVEVPPNCEIQDIDPDTRLTIVLRVFAGRYTRVNLAVTDVCKV